jgi:hypothetical protein
VVLGSAGGRELETAMPVVEEDWLAEEEGDEGSRRRILRGEISPDFWACFS